MDKELNRQAGCCGYFRLALLKPLDYSSRMDALVRKSPDFVFHQKIPPNGGPTLNRLVEEFVTPENDFFLRTHGDLPEIGRSTYRLTIPGAPPQRKTLRPSEITATTTTRRL